MPDDNTFPKAMQRLITNLSVQELELAFVHGRWVIVTSRLAVTFVKKTLSSHIRMHNINNISTTYLFYLLQFPENWGHPQIPVTPPGATLRSRFLPDLQDIQDLMSAWGNLTHTLSGMYCSSLNFLVSAKAWIAQDSRIGCHASCWQHACMLGDLCLHGGTAHLAVDNICYADRQTLQWSPCPSMHLDLTIPVRQASGSLAACQGKQFVQRI